MSVDAIGYGAISGYAGAYAQRSATDISELVAAHIAEQDADGDGQLSVEESEVSSELFNQADSDGDGFVTEAELLAMMQKVRPEAPPPQSEKGEMGEPPEMMSPEDMVASIFEEQDADGDGALSLEESGVDESMFSEADADGDGLVTEEELLAMMEKGRPEGPPPEMGQAMGAGAGGMAAQIIEELDADEDGGVSFSEAGASEEEFDALDTNEDGVVSLAELEAALATIMGSSQWSGLQSANAAGGMTAYRQEMDRLMLKILNGEDSDSSDFSGILSDSGSTGTISLTA